METGVPRYSIRRWNVDDEAFTAAEILPVIRVSKFPDDGFFWFVKWIDRLSYSTETPGAVWVTVLIQQLLITSLDEFNTITHDDVSKRILTTPFGAPQPPTQTIQILVGTLPMFGLGAVFHRQLYIGQLPTHTYSITLPDSESSAIEITLGETLPAPANWTSSKPYQLLNLSEYSKLFPDFGRSRCIVITEGLTDYIIPLAEIFRRYFAPCTALAIALTGGSWATTKHTIVYTAGEYAGLRTQRLEHEWHLLLQANVPDAFARIVSMLFFDPYASSCAAALYANQLKDRGSSRYAPWFFSAHFPFRSDAGPLRLACRGWKLDSLPARLGHPSRKKILITSITETNLPGISLPLKYERLNSNNVSGDEPRHVIERAYYASAPATKQVDHDVVIETGQDANKAEQRLNAKTDDLLYRDVGPIEKLKKLHHNTYTTPPAPPKDDCPPIASTGIGTYQKDCPPQMSLEQVPREEIVNFSHLLAAFEQLADERAFDVYGVNAPGRTRLTILRGTISCWTFLDADRNGNTPSRSGWAMIYPPRSKGPRQGPCPHPYERAALVIRIQCGDKVGYWIEIETRIPTKKGDPKPRGYVSTLISRIEGHHGIAITTTLAEIALLSGTNLGRELPSRLQPFGIGLVACRRHTYQTGNSADLSVDGVRDLLTEAELEKKKRSST